MINNGLADRYTWVVCFIAYCAACTGALACISPGAGPRLSIFFEHVPTAIDAPIVIEAAVYNSTTGSYADNGTFPTGKLMKARVDRVIKGSIDAKHLTIFLSEIAATALASDRVSFSERFEMILSAGSCCWQSRWPTWMTGRKNFSQDMKHFVLPQSARRTNSEPASAESLVLVRKGIGPDVRL